MKEQLILALDLGTQSARAILIDKKGTIIDKEQRKYNPVYNSPVIGYCEQDPNVYFNYLVDACKTLTNNHQDLLNDIIGVVLTTFRDTAVFLDEKMNILRPSILWLDQKETHLINQNFLF